MELTEWIRAARASKGWTQTQLGEALGVTKGNVSAWEKGRHEASFAQLQKIAAATGYQLLTSTASNEGSHPIQDLRQNYGTQTLVALGSATPEQSIAFLRASLKPHSPTRRAIIGNLLSQLAQNPDDAEVAAELAALMEPPAQQTLAA